MDSVSQLMGTEIRFFPLVNMEVSNVLFFAIDSNFTMTSYDTKIEETSFLGAYYTKINLSDNLTNTQKNTIKDLFKGLAYIKFSTI